jgi:hypothetical protein
MKRTMQVYCLVSAIALVACHKGSAGSGSGPGATRGAASAAPGHTPKNAPRIVDGVTACDNYVAVLKSCLAEAAKTEPKLTPAAQEEAVSAMTGNTRDTCTTGAHEKLDENDWAACVITCKEFRMRKAKGAFERVNEENKITSQSSAPALGAMLSAKAGVVTTGTADCDDYLAKSRACRKARYGDDPDGTMASQVVSHFFETNMKSMAAMMTADSCKKMLASFSPDKCN